MGVDGGIPSSSSQIFALSVGNVFSVSLDVPLGQAEIEEEDFVSGFIEANTEVIWLNISMDEMSVMNVFDSCDHLIDQHQDGFERELS